MKNISITVIIAGVLLLITMSSSVFIVSEGQQGIITEFGKPVGNPIATAGVHFKTPFIQKVMYVDKRMLYWDGIPNQIPTKDKKYIRVDTTARWKIINVLKFIQTVQNERGAKARLDAIIDATTRDVISNHNLVEAVRNSNTIVEKISKKRAEIEAQQKKGVKVLEEILGNVVKIEVGREQLSTMIVAKADKELTELGIKLVDVQLRRISYEKSVENKVYERMVSERQKIAQKIRSIGQGEKAKIEGRRAKDLLEIESQAYKQSQIIKGKSEAKAIAIYAKALKQDPKFYDFTRSLEAYKKSISSKAKFLLSSDAEFFKFFKTQK